MAAAVLACLPELTLHSNHHRRWRNWLDRSVGVAAPYAKYVVAVDQQWLVHRISGTRQFLGLSNEGITMVRPCVRADSAVDTVLGRLRGGHGTYWRLALAQLFYMAKMRLKAGAIIAVLFLVCALLFFLLVPEHLLRRANNFAAVTLDGRLLNADAYIGNPTTYESDTFLLIRTSGNGNYLFNFDTETFRPVSSYEFVPLHWAVFIFRPMSKGPWRAPLPNKNLNEFQVVTPNGHTLVVRF